MLYETFLFLQILTIITKWVFNLLNYSKADLVYNNYRISSRDLFSIKPIFSERLHYLLRRKIYWRIISKQLRKDLEALEYNNLIPLLFFTNP